MWCELQRMKNKIFNVKLVLATTATLVITACGGGKSESGGAQNNVTNCIKTEEKKNVIGLTETVFTNTCDFTVILGRGLVSIRTIVTLPPGGTDASIIPGSFIACRPPSRPIDKDDSSGVDFACTD